MEILKTYTRKEKEYETIKIFGYELSSDLLIDESYQRPLSATRVARICNEFNENLVSPIKVSLRDGKFYVFDGQHTKAVLEKMNGDKPVMVDVMVYEFVGLTPVEQKEIEAELFSMQTGLSWHVDSTSKFRALYEANDPEVLQFHAITNKAGVLMDFTRGSKDRKLLCYKEAWNAWNSLGNSLYVDMLKLVLQIWGGDKDSFQAPIIGAMSRFIKAYHDIVDRQILIDSLSKVSPQHIIREGLKNPESSKFKYMWVIRNLYNDEAATKQGVV